MHNVQLLRHKKTQTLLPFTRVYIGRPSILLSHTDQHRDRPFDFTRITICFLSQCSHISQNNIRSSSLSSLSLFSLLGDLGFHEIYHQIRLNLSPDPFDEQIKGFMRCSGKGSTDLNKGSVLSGKGSTDLNKGSV
ncbi:hypothetical protein HanHA300_Chr10g0349941 [Helianthus annuus]|nr:hypothetical protein HanHA300_Chr10g0349941 [Helianthus annuus]KAJ0710717.1 hypothetical protein HanOQP8_Chr09g0315581 [Helianthus annuus]